MSVIQLSGSTPLIFGRKLFEGPLALSTGEARIECAVERSGSGYLVTGKVRGRPGRIEVFRDRAPDEFLLNNWQSWGPFQKMRRGEKHTAIEEIMERYSPYVFSPEPDVFREWLVSDYFIAWPGRLAGFLSSRFAHPLFSFERDDLVGYLDYFEARFDEPIPLEPLFFVRGGQRDRELGKQLSSSPERPVEELLEDYASLAAAENSARVPDRNPVGWSSWYNYFTDLEWEDIERNLRLASADFPFEVFQVDDGYQRDIGDWLKEKPGFHPLPELARLITGYGLGAGIWTAPFSASETSDLFLRNPGWMVQEAGSPKVCYKNWGKEIYALDTTHPAVKAWLSELFSSLRRMGFRYFKIDFLFAAAMPGERVGRVTPIQAYREGMRVIRQASGDSFILGCGAPLLPSAGYVDGMRIGEDTAAHWDSRLGPFQGPNAYRALKNSILRSFLHRRLWLNDPDCLLLRSREIRLTENERKLYALAAGALDNMIIESDDLSLVDERGRDLLRRAIGLRGGRVVVRDLMGDDLYLIRSAGGPAGDVRLLANLADGPRPYGSVVVPARSARFLDEPGGE